MGNSTKYLSLLEQISESDFRNVLVSGPQRCGTTFCAEALATSLGWSHVDEEDYGTHDLDALQRLLAEKERQVIQCPALTHVLTELQEHNLIVFMRRPVEEIVASEKKIRWRELGNEGKEIQKYLQFYPSYMETDKPISQVKFEVWDKEQKAQIKHFFELDYSDLRQAPGWTSKEDRKNFGRKQTSAAPERKSLFRNLKNRLFGRG